MANHTYKNFATLRERIAFQNAVLDATEKMPTILKDARANTKTVATRAFKMYFGAFDLKRFEKVLGILNAMCMAFDSSGIVFERRYGGNPNTCAATAPPGGVWVEQTPQQIAESAHKNEFTYKMFVGEAFYTATNSIDRTIKSAQFNTICHEMSHMVGNTNDPVYGNVQSRILAGNDPTTACDCAENFGFYCEMIYLGL